MSTVTKDMIDEAFRKLKDAREQSPDGRLDPALDIILCQQVDAVMKQLEEERVEAAFAERETNARFWETTGIAGETGQQAAAIRRTDELVRLKNYWWQKYDEAKLIKPQVVGSLTDSALRQIIAATERAQLAALGEFNKSADLLVENAALRKELAEVRAQLEAARAQLPGAMLISQGPLTIVTTTSPSERQSSCICKGVGCTECCGGG